jgi:hypothetical protein
LIAEKNLIPLYLALVGYRISALCIFFAFLLVSCSPVVISDGSVAVSIGEVATESVSSLSTWIPAERPLPLGPQEVRIPMASGRELAGWYFPAAVEDAPVIVLMHWAGGNHWDWDVIARWLQNRDNQVTGVAGTLWSDPYWFPAIREDASFAILTFNYATVTMDPAQRGIVDHFPASVAVVAFAATLEGVDPNRILTMGASIGADSAPNACYLFNQMAEDGEVQGKCIGALSLSPASEKLYMKSATELQAQGAVVYCFGAIDDTQAERACRAVSGEKYHSFIYEGGAHGYYIIDPALFPVEPQLPQNALELMLEFLEQATGLPAAAN